jgi:hypothetical protein
MKPTAIVPCPLRMNIFAVYRMGSTVPAMIIPAIPQTMTGASKKAPDDVINVNQGRTYKLKERGMLADRDGFIKMRLSGCL